MPRARSKAKSTANVPPRSLPLLETCGADLPFCFSVDRNQEVVSALQNGWHTVLCTSRVSITQCWTVNIQHHCVFEQSTHSITQCLNSQHTASLSVWTVNTQHHSVFEQSTHSITQCLNSQHATSLSVWTVNTQHHSVFEQSTYCIRWRLIIYWRWWDVLQN